MNILYIEDNQELAQALKLKLQARYNVSLAASITQAHQLMQQKQFNLLIVDHFLPDGTGLELTKSLRAINIQTPIIFLTVADTKKHIVQALVNGADDYLTKPFDFQELAARIIALLRRNSDYEGRFLTLAKFKLDLETQKLTYNDKLIRFPRQEHLLMQYFLFNPHKLISRQEIYERVWGKTDYCESNTVDVHVKRLRQRLRKYFDQDVIKTVYAQGYRFKPPVKPPAPQRSK
ncbi:MAG: response regulator [Candidatus Pacebacteria bacterium]|nr:response regulator [Candidatus Paceibacterota bacterium]